MTDIQNPVVLEFWFCFNAKFFLFYIGLKVANLDFAYVDCVLKHSFWRRSILNCDLHRNNYICKSIVKLGKLKTHSKPCPSHCTLDFYGRSEHGCDTVLQLNFLLDIVEKYEIIPNKLYLFMCL
jgi:hypothetical protein